MFSVVVDTPDRADSLKRTLRSLLAQVYTASEVVVVDRGQGGASDAVIRELSPRFRGRLRHLRRPDASRADGWNTGIGVAGENYLCFLEAGDELLPLALENHLKCFERHPEADISFGRTIYREASGALAPARESRLPCGDIFARLFQGDISVSPSALACSRGLLELGMRFSTTLGTLEGEDFVLRLAARHRFRCSQEDVVVVGPESRELSAEMASLRVMMLERVGYDYRDRLGAPAIATGLARAEFRAAQAWWRDGGAVRAHTHVVRARRHEPGCLRYWLVAGLIGSRLLFAPRPALVGDRAA